MPVDEPVSTSPGEFGISQLTIVKTYAPGQWTSVSGGNHWRGA